MRRIPWKNGVDPSVGVLFDEEEKAEQLFKEQMEQLDAVLADQSTGKSAAFFYITPMAR